MSLNNGTCYVFDDIFIINNIIVIGIINHSHVYMRIIKYCLSIDVIIILIINVKIYTSINSFILLLTLDITQSVIWCLLGNFMCSHQCFASQDFAKYLLHTPLPTNHNGIMVNIFFGVLPTHAHNWRKCAGSE